MSRPHVPDWATAFARDDRRVTLDHDHQGDASVDIRVFEEFAGPAKVRGGTKHGIKLPRDQLPELINALARAEIVARERLGRGGDRERPRRPTLNMTPWRAPGAPSQPAGRRSDRSGPQGVANRQPDRRQT